VPGRLTPPSGARTLRTDAGRIAVWQVAPGLYASQVAGRFILPMAELIIEVGERQYTGGMVYGFHDWLEMASYESKCRVELTNWVMRHRAESRLSIAVRSKLVAMGVSVANLVLGNLIKIRESTAELEADLALAERQVAAR
jgi:hypothetical protein